MKTARIAFLAAFLTMPLLAQGQMSNNDKAVQEIVDFRNRYIEAEETRDMDYLDKAFAEDFTALNPQGLVLNKQQMMANLKRSDRTVKITNAREFQVRFYGDAAILTERVTVDGVDKGRHFGGEFRFVRIFAKQNGTWKVVLAQGAPLPAPAAEAK